MRFRVLGPLEIHGTAEPLGIPPGRQEVVLAALLLDSNRVVPTDCLVDLIWGENPPETARTQVQICVSRIRRSFREAGVEASITTRSPGYLLRIDDDFFDLAEFRRRVSRTRVLVKEGRTAEAADLLRSAGALWRGPTLNGIPSRVLARNAKQIDEERLAAAETLLQLELDLGRHHQLVAEIGRLVEENPLRDRLRGQLMLALYRSGRQAEALEVFRSGRIQLGAELGLEPSHELRRLEQAILTEDPVLDLPVPETVPRRSAGRAAGGSPTPEVINRPRERQQSGRDSIPRQLPPDTSDFVGDDELIDGVEAVMENIRPNGAVGVFAVLGRPGIGKTTLATHVAHRLSGTRFPDGQLYCDLRGSRSDPVSPREALGRFLRAFGIPGPGIPEKLDERSEMYRDLLATKRVIVVLDDAAGENQILPLLPGTSSCVVMVTSRARLTGMPGAHHITLDVLKPHQAMTLLGHVVGHERVAREREAAEVLVEVVGGLPLALRIVAARLAARPHWSLASMVQRLGDERRRLDELAHGEMTIRTSLSLTYDSLGATERRLFQLLSMPRGPTLPGWLAGPLLDDNTPYPSDLLEPLIDMQMLDVVGVGRTGEFHYRFHEIIRLFAREQLTGGVSPQDQRGALRRMIGGWLTLATHANRSIFGTDSIQGDAPRWCPPDTKVRELLADPLEWMDTERENLTMAVEHAVQEGEDELSWELAVTLASFFEARGHLDNWARTHRKAINAVRRVGNTPGQAALLGSLGTLYLNRRQLSQSHTALSDALTMFRELSNSKGIALCLRDLAFLERIQGNDDKAMALYKEAAQHFDRIDDLVGRASLLTQSADVWLRRGRFTDVQARLEEALEIYRSVGYQGGVAHALQRMGQVHLQRGELARAEGVLADVLTMVRNSGDVIGEGHLLHDLGRVNSQLGRYNQATEFLTHSLSIREAILDQSGIASIRLDLAALLIRQDQPIQARSLIEQAIPTFRARHMHRELFRAQVLLAQIAGPGSREA